MIKKSVPLKTALNTGRSLTDEEKKEAAKEWAEQTLNALITYADFDNSFAKQLCIIIADTYGSDDILSSTLLSRMRIDRKGKKRGAPKKWDDARYRELLMFYNISINQGEPRQKVLSILAKREEFTGIGANKRIEKKITEARKAIDQESFPEPFQPPALRNKGG